jgi:hypothetical protein
VHIDCRLSAPADHDVENYCVHIFGTVIVTVSNDDDLLAESRDLAVGSVVATLFKIGQARNNRIDALNVLDSDSQDSAECMALFDKHGYLLNSVLDALSLSTSLPDVLLVERIVIAPEHRGRDLGLHAMHALINTFGNGEVLVVCKPFPIPADNESDLDDAAIRVGQRKLRAYWSRAGFTRFRKQELYMRSGETDGVRSVPRHLAPNAPNRPWLVDDGATARVRSRPLGGRYAQTAPGRSATTSNCACAASSGGRPSVSATRRPSDCSKTSSRRSPRSARRRHA